MHLTFSKEDEAFRSEVRAFIAERFDEDLRHKMACTKNGYLDKAGQVKWQKALTYRGWAAGNWQKEYGGLGLDQARRLNDLEQENARLKRVVADLSLDNLILKEVSTGKF